MQSERSGSSKSRQTGWKRSYSRESTRSSIIDAGFCPRPWRRQLHRFEDATRPLERQRLVRWLAREGLTPAGELAWLAGHIARETTPDTLTIQQVVRFADSLTGHVANAGPSELIHATFLQRGAARLANRMIEWVNAGRL